MTRVFGEMGFGEMGHHPPNKKNPHLNWSYYFTPNL